MFIRILVFFALYTSASLAQQEPLNLTAGATADSLLQTLPRDSSSCETLGILFANKVFLKQSSDGRSDADSAVAYLACALAHGQTPRLRVYACIAQVLRATKDGLFAKIMGRTIARATQAFENCDSIARHNPADLGVQFLAANLLEEGDKLDQKKYYWQRAWDILAILQASDTDTTSFFTPEVRANILLNQGKLIQKLHLYDDASEARADDLWLQTVQNYPNTNAAENARHQLAEH